MRKMTPDSIPLSCPIQIDEPAGFYVYAYIDPMNNEIFYIGKGHRNRLTRHLTRKSLQKRDTFFYRKLKKMLRHRRLPVVLVIKDNLTEDEAFQSEIDLIYLVGTRALGTGTLCNTRTDIRGAPAGYTLAQGIKNGTAIECWGELFASKLALIQDQRCCIKLDTLIRRLKAGIPVEKAVTEKYIRRKVVNVKPITCWNQEFTSIQKLSEDRRCKVSESTLRKRLKKGLEPEKACEGGRVKPGSRSKSQSRKPQPGKPTTCWGQEFPSQSAAARDPRCVVSPRCFRERLYRGWSPDRAATQPLDQIAARRG